MTKVNIMIVEDDAITALDIENQLKNLGYSVSAKVSRGEKAIQKAKENTPDLVLMDIILKGEMDGIEAAEAIHTQFNIPIVFLTAYADKNRLTRAKLTNPYGYILKPFHDKDLEVTIEMALYVAKADAERRQAEEALKEKTDRLLKAQRIARMGFLDWNLKTNEMYWSDQIYDLYGIDRQEQISNIDLTMELVHPDDLEFVEKNLDLAIKGIKEYDIDHRKLRPDGTVVWVHAQAEVVHDADGNPESLLGTVVDITDRKQAEEALLESEEKFRSLSENSQDYIMRYDEQGRHLYQNAAGFRVSGFSEEEFIGKTHRELGFTEDLCDLWEEKITGVFRSGLPTGEIFEWESVDGTVFLDWRLYPEFGQDGKVKTVLGVSRDITEQKEAEEALRESEEKYRLLAKNLPDIIFKGYKDWSVEFFDEKIKILTGYDTDEFNSNRMKWIDIIIEEDIENIRNSFIQALRTDKSYVREYRIRSKTGDIFWIQERGHIVCDSKGEIEYVSGIFFDITERRQVEKKLKESEMSFRIIAEETGQLLYSFDPKTGKVKWSGAVEAVTGYTYEEYRSFDVDAWAEHIHPDDRKMVLKTMDEAVEHHTRFDVKYRFRRKDGSYIFVEEQGAFVPDSESASYPTVGAISNITERKRTEEELKKVIKKLRAQIESEGLTPVADDPINEVGK